MRKILTLLFSVLVLFMVVPAHSANTITRTGNFVTIEDIDSDWLWSDTFPNYPKIRLVGIQFNPGLAADQCIIFENTVSGSTIMDVTAEDVYDQRYKPVGVDSRPVLDFSAGTYSSGSKIIFTFDLD